MTNHGTSVKPRIGISRCLLGDAVRYDAQAKPCTIVLDELADLFELVAVCPEVEAGLGVPRPPVQLTGSLVSPRLTGRDDSSLDVTDVMQDYCRRKPAELSDLHGFVFKSRSPSCGLRSTPVFVDGVCISENSSGVFARAMCEAMPQLAVIEETQLEDTEARRHFIASVLAAARQAVQGQAVQGQLT